MRRDDEPWAYSAELVTARSRVEAVSSPDVRAHIPLYEGDSTRPTARARERESMRAREGTTAKRASERASERAKEREREREMRVSLHFRTTGFLGIERRASPPPPGSPRLSAISESRALASSSSASKVLVPPQRRARHCQKVLTNICIYVYMYICTYVYMYILIIYIDNIYLYTCIYVYIDLFYVCQTPHAALSERSHKNKNKMHKNCNALTLFRTSLFLSLSLSLTLFHTPPALPKQARRQYLVLWRRRLRMQAARAGPARHLRAGACGVRVRCTCEWDTDVCLHATHTCNKSLPTACHATQR